jgi:hypothetical protein
VASGKAGDLLRALECLFKIAAKQESSPEAVSPALKLGVFLEQLLSRANKSILMPHDDLLCGMIAAIPLSFLRYFYFILVFIDMCNHVILFYYYYYYFYFIFNRPLFCVMLMYRCVEL